MVVIDASALVDALLINGAARSRLAAESLQAPELIDAELLSVLRRLVLRRLVLAGKLPDREALQALTTAHQLGLRRHPSRALWVRAWELRSNLSAYDALYVALAEQLDALAHCRCPPGASPRVALLC